VSRVRGAAELAVWWLLLSSGYLGLLSSPTGWEVPLALGIGGVAAVAAVLGRRAFEPALRAPAFVRRAAWLPVDVVTDATVLTRLLLTGRALRSDCGVFDELPLPDNDEATRAWAVLLTSAAPGSLTVDVETREGRAMLRRHRMTPLSRASAGLAGR
jgi:hypothetical protein